MEYCNNEPWISNNIPLLQYSSLLAPSLQFPIQFLRGGFSIRLRIAEVISAAPKMVNDSP